MRNTKRAMTFVVAVFSLFFVLVSAAHSQHPGMGTTNYATIGTVKEGELAEFKVARLYNTGDIALQIIPKWVADDKFPGVNITFLHNPIDLAIDERKVIYVSVEGIKLGNFSGVIHFESNAQYPAEVSGNPSYPASTIGATFIVTGKPFNWTPFIIGFVAVGALGVGATVFLKKRRDTTTVNAKTKKTRKGERKKKKKRDKKNEVHVY